MGKVYGIFKNANNKEIFRYPVDQVIHKGKYLYRGKKYKTYIDNEEVYLIFIKYV